MRARITTAPATIAHPATCKGAKARARILLPTFEILEQLGTIVFGRVAGQIILGATDVVVLIIGERGVLLDDLMGTGDVPEHPVAPIFFLSACAAEIRKSCGVRKVDCIFWTQSDGMTSRIGVTRVGVLRQPPPWLASWT